MLLVIKRTMMKAPLIPLLDSSHYFDQLVDFLNGHGYEVVVRWETAYPKKSTVTYRHASISGLGIIGAFCESNDQYGPYLDGRIAVDNSECFNKISQCPCIMELPKIDSEFQLLLDSLRYLATAEGAEWSDRFGYLSDKRLPYELGE